MSEKEGEMHDKICLVTGASRGIGFYTARGLALEGAHVVLVGHDKERGQAAVQRIQESAGEDAATFMLADLSSQDQIYQLSQAFHEQYAALHVLVNNAGGWFLRRTESVDGIEMTWALDYINYFVTTNLLLDMLQASAPARIVNVASESHRGAEMHFDDLQLRKGYGGMAAYGQAKLADVLLTYELARRLAGTGITANALHPGFVKTHIGKQNPLVSPFLNVIHFFFAKSPEEGAETSVYLASSPEVEGISGKYFIDKKPRPSSPASYDEEAARRLWEASEKMVKEGIPLAGLSRQESGV